MPPNRNTISMLFALLKRELNNAFNNNVVKTEIKNITALTTPLLRSLRSLNRGNELTEKGNREVELVRQSIENSRNSFHQFTGTFENAIIDVISELEKHSERLTNLSEIIRTVKVENLRDIEFSQLDDLVLLGEREQERNEKLISYIYTILTSFKKTNELLSVLSKKSIEFPKVQKIEGNTTVTALPKIEELVKTVQTLSEIRDVLKQGEKREQKEIKIKDKGDLTLKIYERLINKLDEVKESIQNITIPAVEFPDTINVGNFPPQKYPLPVTHISLNALAGEVRSRSVTVGTSLTPLPGEVLDNRRSIIVYNNSTVTVEVGGSTFTFGEGLPIPVGSYSPPIDAGEKMIVYGRVASGTADVRVLEVSDIMIGR